MPARWQLSCLLCGLYDSHDLVKVQEHAMQIHGVSREALQRAECQGPIVVGDVHVYNWRLPPDAGGRRWLRAVKEAHAENHLGML